MLIIHPKCQLVTVADIPQSLLLRVDKTDQCNRVIHGFAWRHGDGPSPSQPQIYFVTDAVDALCRPKKRLSVLKGET